MARNVTYSVAPRIHFRPGTTLAGMLTNLTFAKVPVKYINATTPGTTSCVEAM
jgi:hypothetical protein